VILPCPRRFLNTSWSLLESSENICGLEVSPAAARVQPRVGCGQCRLTPSVFGRLCVAASLFALPI
jgi:hypothetical protein